MKKLLLPVFAIAALVSCKKTVVSSPADQFGYVNFDLSADTEMTVITKAEPTAEELATYNVSLHNSTGLIETKEYAEIAELGGWKVPAGIYKVYVENYTEDEATPQGSKGSIRLASLVEDVEVTAGVGTEVNVQCVPVNSRVTVAFDANFGAVFTDPVVNLAGGLRSFDMTWGHEVANSVYYPAETEISWSLTASLAGEQRTYQSTEKILTQSGKWTQITFSASTTDGSINVNITVSEDFGEPVQELVSINPFE